MIQANSIEVTLVVLDFKKSYLPDNITIAASVSISRKSFLK